MRIDNREVKTAQKGLVVVETVHATFVKFLRKQELIVKKIHLRLFLLRHMTVDVELTTLPIHFVIIELICQLLRVNSEDLSEFAHKVGTTDVETPENWQDRRNRARGLRFR